jgi:peptidyl-prolyl cis-trans isomerase B (cyclophilin B)
MIKKYLLWLIVSDFILSFSVPLHAQGVEGNSEPLIQIETSLGTMLLKLHNETPLHRDNMLKLIENGYFTNQLFHRVIGNFMIQGGDPHSSGAEKGQRLGTGGPGYTVPAEFRSGLFHRKGALCAARQGDQLNPEKASNGSQFYIVQGRVLTREEINLMVQRGMITVTDEAAQVYMTEGGTPHLDGSYTVFGQLVEGMDVLDRIAGVETDSYNRPLEDVIYTIKRIR